MHRCRLTLIAAGPLGGPAQVVDVDDVVALEHARRPVAGERHDGVRRRSAADQVPDAAPPQVVHDAARETERGAGFRPELPEVPDAAAVAVEDVWTIKAARLPATRDDGRELASVDREDASVPVLTRDYTVEGSDQSYLLSAGHVQTDCPGQVSRRTSVVSWLRVSGPLPLVPCHYPRS